MKLLKKLSETPAAPGREERLRDLIKNRVETFCDDVEVDPLGNLICTKRATDPPASGPLKVMVSAHMDEIAFYVRKIDQDGFLRVNELGGFDVRNLFARQVMIQGRRDLFGVLNPSVPPVHLATAEERKKLPLIKDFYIDTGLPHDQLLELVRPGDPVTLVQTFREMGANATGKCMDNRVACWVGIRLLEQLKTSRYDLSVAFTAQEEVGIRGAKTCAFKVQPDIGVAVDVTLAIDTPGVPKEDGITELGKGIAIKIMDSASISDRGLVDELIAVAEENDITHQLEILPRGGTDAHGIQLSRGGVKVVTLSVPCRYVHTVIETIHKDDLQGCVDLLLAYLAR